MTKKAENKKKLRDAVDNARPAESFASHFPSGSTFGLPAGCPVIPLGLNGQERFYLDSKRQLIPLLAKEHTRLQINGLFGDQQDFVYSVREWQRRNADGDVTDWRPGAVAEALLRSCGKAGVWDAATRERGRGAWRGDDGELVIHSGDQIAIYGQLDPWGLRIELRPGMVGRYVYPTAEAIPRAAIVPEDGASNAADAILNLLETWNWRRPTLDPILCLGWIAAAMIGGALKWRPVIWISGGKGTGKSTLQKAIEALLGSAMLALADTTAAGIYQTLQHQTLPVAVDELEATEDNRRALDVVKLARIASSGGRMARGSDKHSSHEFLLQSCFLFSSVLVPPLGGPDRSRIALLELDELDPLSAEPNISAQRLNQLGTQMRRRMILGWPRFADTLERYRTLLSGGGHTKRGSDQFGTLLTCADLALFGADGEGGRAAHWFDQGELAALLDMSDDDADQAQCLQHLLGSPLDVHRNGQKATLGEWINRACGRDPTWAEDWRAAAKVIQSYGVRYEIVRPTGPNGRTTYWIAIAHAHTALSTLFERTRWATPRGLAGVWVQALRRLPGAEKSGPLYFGGPTSRATLLPLHLIPEPDSQENKPAFAASSEDFA